MLQDSVMEIPTREDFGGMVWMGDMLPQNEPNDLMTIEPVSDNPFFVDIGGQTLSDEEIRCSRSQMGMEFMMLEDLDESTRWYVNEMPEEMLMDNDSSNSAKVVNTATQTGMGNITHTSRKIKPVRHPGLKLQTPIAYQRDTDLDVIPIQKDGRAVCKKCGAIGVKHAFYTRERRYCSLACARGFVDGDSSGQEMGTSPSNVQWPEEGVSPQQQSQQQPSPTSQTDTIPQGQLIETNQSRTVFMCNQSQFAMPSQQTILESQLPPAFVFPSDDPPYPEKRQPSTGTHNWAVQLGDPFFCAAPTSCFQHAPMADLWHYIDVGLKVEVENTDTHDFCEDTPNSFWIANVLRVEGYKALLRYEGFVADDSKDFWINLCSSKVHPVGWCAIRGKPLIPPHTIKDKYSNWKEFLKRRLTGARTLPSNFYSKVLDSLRSRFRCDLTVEVVDKSRISQVKVATIEKITGKRLQLRYYDSKPNTVELFWCHEDSPLIHPVGWAKRVGQKLDASPQYLDRMMKGLREKDDATADLFAIPDVIPLPPNCYFQEGMKLEAIDPLNLSDICVATVMRVLNDGYLMIRVDFWNDQNPSTDDWFCYHMSSPCIFPAGFCATNGIPLTPPKDYNKENFDWNHYLQETGCVAAPPQLFNQEVPDHGFKPGMRIEAADLMNPRLICVATIVQIIGRLMKVHFDGWEDDFDQWVDCKSCDIYPVGWCEVVEHKLEPPLSESKPSTLENRTSGRTRKKGKGRTSGGATIKNEMNLMEYDEKENAGHSVNSTLSQGVMDVSGDNWCSSQMSPSMDSKSFMDNDTNSAALARVNLSNCSLANTSGTQQSLQAVILTEQNACILQKPKFIPRLSDYKTRGSSLNITPETWDVNDVAEFLKINDCSTYCDAFIEQSIDGRKLMNLTKEEIHKLAGMKVGPSLKIQNLVDQLTSKNNPGHSRYNKLSKNVL